MGVAEPKKWPRPYPQGGSYATRRPSSGILDAWTSVRSVRGGRDVTSPGSQLLKRMPCNEFRCRGSAGSVPRTAGGSASTSASARRRRFGRGGTNRALLRRVPSIHFREPLTLPDCLSRHRVHESRFRRSLSGNSSVSRVHIRLATCCTSLECDGFTTDPEGKGLFVSRVGREIGLAQATSCPRILAALAGMPRDRKLNSGYKHRFHKGSSNFLSGEPTLQ